MKIISWNVNGLRATRKKNFDEAMKKESPDILCLQETKAQDEEVLGELTEWNGYHIHVNSAEKKVIPEQQSCRRQSRFGSNPISE